MLAFLPTALWSQHVHRTDRERERLLITPSREPVKLKRVGRTDYREKDGIIAGIYEQQEEIPGFSAREIATKFIERHKAALGINGAVAEEVRYRSVFEDAGTYALRFRQYYRGVSVDDNSIMIYVNRENRVRFVQNNFEPVPDGVSIEPLVSEKAAIATALRHFRLAATPENLTIKKLIHFVEDRPRLCYRIGFVLMRPHGDWQSYVDAQSGKLIEVLDGAYYQDCSPGGNFTGRVFLPDPISTSQATYGTGGFVAYPDVNNADLENQLRLIQFSLSEQQLNTTGPTRLRGPRAYDANGACNVNTINGNATFNRADNCFEPLMCYYHLDRVLCHYYGMFPPFEGMAPDSTVTGPNYSDGGSQYQNAVRFEVTNNDFLGLYAAGQKKLYFGYYENSNTGERIEGAEDASVIIHELGHAIHHWISDDTLSVVEGLTEGFADYWAQSYVRSLGVWPEYDPRYQWVNRWASFNDIVEPAGNRTTDYNTTTPYHYPDGLPTSDYHLAGQYFSTVLMRIYDDIGKDKTDYIAIAGMGMTGKNTSQSVAAEFIYERAVNAGYSEEELCIIYRHFETFYSVRFNPTPPTGSADYYLRDTPADFGVESNPDLYSGTYLLRATNKDGEFIGQVWFVKI